MRKLKQIVVTHVYDIVDGHDNHVVEQEPLTEKKTYTTPYPEMRKERKVMKRKAPTPCSICGKYVVGMKRHFVLKHTPEGQKYARESTAKMLRAKELHKLGLR